MAEIFLEIDALGEGRGPNVDSLVKLYLEGKVVFSRTISSFRFANFW